MICIPSGITEVEKRAVKDSSEHAGAKEVYLIHEPMAAAIGIGIDVEEPMGNMIIDIGGGTSEIAVIALGGIVCDKNIRVAGDEFTNDIEEYMRRQHNILVGERTAETIKIEVGAAMTELDNPPPDYAVRGRDLMTGIPKEITVTYSGDRAGAGQEHQQDRRSHPERVGSHTARAERRHLQDRYLSRPVAVRCSVGLDKRISIKTKLPVHVSEDPLACGGARNRYRTEEHRSLPVLDARVGARDLRPYSRIINCGDVTNDEGPLPLSVSHPQYVDVPRAARALPCPAVQWQRTSPCSGHQLQQRRGGNHLHVAEGDHRLRQPEGSEPQAGRRERRCGAIATSACYSTVESRFVRIHDTIR